MWQIEVLSTCCQCLCCFCTNCYTCVTCIPHPCHPYWIWCICGTESPDVCDRRTPPTEEVMTEEEEQRQESDREIQRIIEKRRDVIDDVFQKNVTDMQITNDDENDMRVVINWDLTYLTMDFVNQPTDAQVNDFYDHVHLYHYRNE